MIPVEISYLYSTAKCLLSRLKRTVFPAPRKALTALYVSSDMCKHFRLQSCTRESLAGLCTMCESSGVTLMFLGFSLVL